MPGPLATPDQIEIETIAAELRSDADLAPVFARIAEEWRARMPADEANLARFPAQFESAAICGCMFAANDDPLYPRLHAFGRLGHDTNGHPIPSTKSGHPNIDYIYRFAAIDGGSRYIIRGRLPEVGPIAIEYSLLTATQVYEGNISLRELTTDGAGRFEITVDPDPAGDRPNHFQTSPESVQLLLRDVISDPRGQLPAELTIERLGPPPERPRQSLEEMKRNVERQVRKHIDDLDYTTFEFVLKRPVNSFAAPVVSRDGILSVAQAYSPGHYQIAEDEALIVTMTLAGAAYAVVPVTDLWGGVGNMLEHRTALGTGLARPNPEGSYTFVVSLSDPGVANWVDPDGLTHGVVFFRWIGLDPGSEEAPRLDTRIAKLSDLPAALPDGTPWMTPADRRIDHDLVSAAYAELFS